MEEQNIILFVFANKEIPGRVTGKTPNGSVFVKPLIDRIPLQDGGFATEFFARARDAGGAEEGEFITFFWSQPGERGLHPTTKQPDKPVAQNVRVVSEAIAYNLIDEILVLVSNHEKEDLQNQKKLHEIQLEQCQLGLDIEYKAKQDLLSVEIQELEKKSQQISLDRDNLEYEQSKIEQKRDSLEKKEKEVFRIKEEINRYTALLPLIENNIQSTNILPVSTHDNSDLKSENLGNYWSLMLASRGLILPESIKISYLIAIITALCSGSIVLLNGTVGVGKTSIIQKSAEALGGKAEIIPIRPSWLDPSDLLGFFDPISEVFRPSSFTTALKKAYKDPDRIFLICLDELNLAKIENYGADLLSTIEYSKSQVNRDIEGSKLSLYSEDIQTVLWGKLMLLNSIQNHTPDQLLLIKKLERLNDTPAKLEIPQNLVLIGTLNSDETTYDLSPKAIDRSYVITYPPADLRLEGEQFIEDIQMGYLSVGKIQSEIKYCVEQIQGTGDLADTWRKDWNRIIDWNERYLINKIGIPVGYRIKREYQIFFAVAHSLGITDENHCLGYFIFTKLLPRISFIKNDERETLCQEWIKEIREEYSMGGEIYILDQIDEQISESQRRNVRYWG